jgi:hypothetical protein
MTASPTTSSDLTQAERLAAAVTAATDPNELALLEAAMGPADERNRPLVLALLTLLDGASGLAAAIDDNAIESKRIPTQGYRLALLTMAKIASAPSFAAARAAAWDESDALSALPEGYRLPTHLDACHR